MVEWVLAVRGWTDGNEITRRNINEFAVDIIVVCMLGDWAPQTQQPVNMVWEIRALYSAALLKPITD